jgi:hypothetical protein
MNKITLEQTLSERYTGVSAMKPNDKISGYAVASLTEARKAHVAVFDNLRDAEIYKGKLQAAGMNTIQTISLKEQTTTQRVVEATKKKLGVNQVIVEVV